MGWDWSAPLLRIRRIPPSLDSLQEDLLRVQAPRSGFELNGCRQDGCRRNASTASWAQVVQRLVSSSICRHASTTRFSETDQPYCQSRCPTDTNGSGTYDFP